MNLDRRLGNQDADAATLFATARSFRPSARGRRRALRALGLPIGLSLFGSGLAHAAYLLSTSVKGWGLVAGVVAGVGAAGGVTYVVATAPADPPSMRRRGAAKEASSMRGATTAAAGGSSLPAVPEGPRVSTGTPADTAPAPASTSALPGVAAPSLPRPAPGATRPLAMRADTRAATGAPRDHGGDASPPEPSATAPVERPIVPVAPPPFPVPPIALPQAATSVSSSLKGELALVTDAQARLRTGDGRGSFVALDLHRRLYPNGALAEEVELLRLRALIVTGDARGAREAGETFLRRHPISPLGGRVRSLMTTLDMPGKP